MKQLLIAFILSLFSTMAFADDNHYIIMIDAGSAGARLYLYQYEEGGHETIPVIKDIYSKSTEVAGLSFYENQPEKAGELLADLMSGATQYLQRNNIDPKTVSVNVLATAGMRLLPEEKQQAIYRNIVRYLKNHTVFALGDIRTIKPEEEALYGWLDVNYLAGNFQNHTPTVGSIDLGGASLEVAFESKMAATVATTNSMVTVGGQSYPVFVKSFLGLGEDEARKAILASPAVGSCYPVGYTLNEIIVGNFNQATCKPLYETLLQQYSLTKQIPLVKGQRFIAYSSIYYRYHDFGIEQTPDRAILEEHIQSTCTNSMDQIKKNYPQIGEQYFASFCADGVFIDALLFDTLGLNGSQLTVTNRINQQVIDWPLGALLYSLSK